MTIQPILLKKLEQLPHSMQTEVLHYIEFLLTKCVPRSPKFEAELQTLSEEEAEKRYGYGSMAGEIVMSDDFDEPLDDLAEYQ